MRIPSCPFAQLISCCVTFTVTLPVTFQLFGSCSLALTVVPSNQAQASTQNLEAPVNYIYANLATWHVEQLHYSFAGIPKNCCEFDSLNDGSELTGCMMSVNLLHILSTLKNVGKEKQKHGWMVSGSKLPQRAL